MPSTYSNSNGLEKPATGEQVNTWGQTYDATMDLIDEALDGVSTVNLTASAHFVTTSNGVSSEGRCRVLVFTGNPPIQNGYCVISLPPGPKNYWIVNDSQQSLLIQAPSSSSFIGNVATLTPGASMPVYSDGGGNLNSLSSVSQSQSVNGDLSVTGAIAAGQGISAGGDINTPGNIAATGKVFSAGVDLLAQINSVATSSGANPVSAIRSDTGFFIFTFGNVAGSRVEIGYGSGAYGGSTPSLPVGFSNSTFRWIVSGSSWIGLIYRTAV